jgi:hypothetical protein
MHVCMYVYDGRRFMTRSACLNKEETQRLEDKIHYHTTHTTALQQNDVSRFGKIPYME